MTGGSTIVEFWRDDQKTAGDAPQSGDILLLDEAVVEEPDDSGDSSRHRLRLLLGFVALLWCGLALWAMIASGTLGADPAGWPVAVATLSAPLILIGLAYMLILRGSRSESRRYLAMARGLRSETELLEARLGRVATQLHNARQTMQDQAELLDSYGAAASSNMEASAELLAGRADATAARTEAAERATEALLGKLETLIAAIPALEERSGSMAAQMMDNGRALAERVDMLEARLQALTELSDEARARTLAATKSLSGQLTQLREETRAATDEVSGLSDIAASRIGAAAAAARQAMDEGRARLEDESAHLSALVTSAQDGLASTSDALRQTLGQDLDMMQSDMRLRLDAALQAVRGAMNGTEERLGRQVDMLETLVANAHAGIEGASENAMAMLARDMGSIEADLRQRLDAALDRAQETLALADGSISTQSEALEALIARSRDVLAAVGAESVTGLGASIGEVEQRLQRIDQLVDGQRALMTGLQQQLGDAIGDTETRFAALEDVALARSSRLTEALARMTAETQRIDAALTSGGATADKLIRSAETLMMALDSSVRELDETYPNALERFDARLHSSRALLGSAVPEIERLEAISEALVGRSEEAETVLRGQSQRLGQWLEDTEKGVEASRAQVEQLRGALDAAHQDTTRITEGAGPLLVTALLRVKETAEQAAERARQALGRAIPDVAEQLAEASEAALHKAVDEKVAAQIERLAVTADDAVKAAQQASDRLMRQLLTIADTSASVEKRIEEAERAAGERDKDHFARRSSLLIDSLNSIAIDVTKILSDEVTDASWAAYLKGDRGVFTRRAVKLLDANEARDIAAHYDADADFREHVNRYIHDFEAMLRVILSARDGNALGVAILSSDMGKLYVALAQAIERLRQ